MSDVEIHFLTKINGIYEQTRSEDPIQNKIYEDFFNAISSRDLAQCLRLLTTLGDSSFTVLNQLIFICGSECCNPNCLALNLCHYAVLNECEDITKELLKHGGDLSRKVVEVSTTGNLKQHCENESVIDLIVRRFNEPDNFLKDLLDEFIENSELERSYEFRIDFSILLPSTSAQEKQINPASDHQMCVLNTILNAFSEVQSPSECSFLQHPLIEVFLTCKWWHYRRFFYILVATHVLFVSLLSLYASIMVKNYERFVDLQKNYESNNFVETKEDESWFYLKLLNNVLLLVGFQLFWHAIIQACFLPIRKLIFDFEIISNLITSTAALFNFIYGIIQPINFQHKNHFELSYLINSLIILPAWINLMLIIGRIPVLGCYSLMFTTVLKNFLKVTASFIFLLIGFAMTFSLIFPKATYFNRPLGSIIKTFVMMMGEYNYSETFPENSNGISKLVFILFLVSCSIILMNLTQGIAVNDVKILHEISQTIRLEKEIRFLYEFESIFTQRIMTSSRILKKIKQRLYDNGAIVNNIKISKRNRNIIPKELLAKLIRCYKPIKCQKMKPLKFHFECVTNRFVEI